MPYNFSHDNIMAVLLVNYLRKAPLFNLVCSKTQFTTLLFITSILKNLLSPSLPRFSCFLSSFYWFYSFIVFFTHFKLTLFERRLQLSIHVWSLSGEVFFSSKIGRSWAYLTVRLIPKVNPGSICGRCGADVEMM